MFKLNGKTYKLVKIDDSNLPSSCCELCDLRYYCLEFSDHIDCDGGYIKEVKTSQKPISKMVLKKKRLIRYKQSFTIIPERIIK